MHWRVGHVTALAGITSFTPSPCPASLTPRPTKPGLVDTHPGLLRQANPSLTPSPEIKALGLPPRPPGQLRWVPPPPPTGHPSKTAIFLLFVRVRNDKYGTLRNLLRFWGPVSSTTYPPPEPKPLPPSPKTRHTLRNLLRPWGPCAYHLPPRNRSPCSPPPTAKPTLSLTPSLDLLLFGTANQAPTLPPFFGIALGKAGWVPIGAGLVDGGSGRRGKGSGGVQGLRFPGGRW